MDSKEIAKAIGKKIQEARLMRKLTQEKLAELCEISSNHISTIENGRSTCSYLLLIKLCNILDITPNFIFSSIITSNNDTLQSINPDILLTYMRLHSESQSFANDVIYKLYDLQKKR